MLRLPPKRANIYVQTPVQRRNARWMTAPLTKTIRCLSFIGISPLCFRLWNIKLLESERRCPGIVGRHGDHPCMRIPLCEFIYKYKFFCTLLRVSRNIRIECHTTSESICAVWPNLSLPTVRGLVHWTGKWEKYELRNNNNHWFRAMSGCYVNFERINCGGKVTVRPTTFLPHRFRQKDDFSFASPLPSIE